MKVLLVICVFALCMVLAIGEDYCKIPGCKGQPHIGCNNNGSISERCISGHAEFINLDEKLKERFVELHNEYREIVASGNLPKYQPAARMGSVTWDDELAELALLNLKRCDFQHDKCRSTKKFYYAGQNLAMSGSFPAKTIIEAITISVEGWYNENVYGDMNLIDKFYPTQRVTGHFTQVVNERSSKIGCALVRKPQSGGPMTQYYTTCNYARTNVIGESVYTTGTPASGCKTGRHPRYPSLCSPAEKYDVAN